MKKKIILIVSISVLIILIVVGVLIYTNRKTPVVQSIESEFKTALNEYNAQLNMALSSMLVENVSFDADTFNIGTWNGNANSTNGTIKQYINNISSQDGSKFAVKNGKLVYVGSDEQERKWAADVGIGSDVITSSAGIAVNAIATQNSTMNGKTPTYNNPIIPKGFMAVNDGATWPTDWNKGLVIQDANANQFVWVPVDGNNVIYTKWDGAKTLIKFSNTSDDTLPNGISKESSQITKYGGFYIARYEAGKDANNALVSKKNIPVWNNINYFDSKSKAEAMYNNDSVKSGLVTGTQWDTVMAWLKIAGYNVENDSSTIGNFINTTNRESISPNNPAKTGASENWKTNNIYDLAGNTFEWTNEKNGTYYINRSGSYVNYGDVQPAMYREHSLAPDMSDYLSFRVCLYII